MSVVTLEHVSSVLPGSRTVHLVLPETPPDPSVGGYRSAWLLHGRGETSEAWLGHGALTALAERYRCVMIMPTVHNTRYANAVDGEQNWDYLSRELPQWLEARLALAPGRRDRWAIGFSIGGFAALKLGIARGDRFGAAVSLSGALQLELAQVLATAEGPSPRRGWLRRIYGDGPDYPDPDDRLLETAARREAEGKPIAALELRTGEADGSTHLNRLARDRFAGIGIDVPLHVLPGGHDRAFCDRQLEPAFRFLAAATGTDDSTTAGRDA